MGKKSFFVSLIINIIFIGFFTTLIVNKGGLDYVEKKIFPISYSEVNNKKFEHVHIVERNIQRVSLFDILPATEKDIIFVGNSMTSSCEWAEILNNNKIKNRGILGDNSLGILNRIDRIAKFKPQKIFLMVGINDLSGRIKTDSITRNYANIIRQIKQFSPQTKIYVQSVLPINDDYKEINNEQIIDLNSKIKNVATEYNVTYIDIFSHLLDSSGKLRKEYSNDEVTFVWQLKLCIHPGVC